jgi:acetyltransferase
MFRLKDGTAVALRQIRPDDKDRLADGWDHLSPLTQYHRFLAAHPHLSKAELRYLTEVDGHDHVALVAVLVKRPDRIVAVGRYVRLEDDPQTAEFAVTVGDPWQRQGLGTELGRRLARHARLNGIRHFTATTLDENVGVRRLIAAIGEHLAYERQGTGVTEVVADLADAA